MSGYLATIASTKANPILAQNSEYIDRLKQVHSQCLGAATPQQRETYYQAIANLTD